MKAACTKYFCVNTQKYFVSTGVDAMPGPVLELRDLAVSFYTPQGEVQAVRGVDLSVGAGEVMCVVGESGCGKTVMCQSVLRLLPRHARIKRGQVILDGQDVTRVPERTLRRLRGGVASMVFQDPLQTLDPTMPVGRQIAEAVRKHEAVSRAEAFERAVRLMDMVGIERARERARLQPHFFSGGMRQRCVLAAALAAGPKLLIADEPTTALDVTIEAKMLDLLLEIRNRTGVGIVLVTHDLGVVAHVADSVSVMYAGKIVETGTAEEIFRDPRHPYTWGLMVSLPSLAEGGALNVIPGAPPALIDPPPGDAFAARDPYALAIDYEEMPPMFRVTDTHRAATWLLDPRAPRVEPPVRAVRHGDAETPPEAAVPPRGAYLVEARGIRRHFSVGRHMVIKAVDGLSFGIRPGEVFGLVGESGCGKSTTARVLAGIYAPTGGDIIYDGVRVSGAGASKAQRRRMQREVQVIFQDPAASLDPRMTVAQLVAEPYAIRRVPPDRARIADVLRDVGLDETCLARYSGELSGGQRQRVAIARSLMTDPRLIIADEPIASLDISIQAQIVMLLKRLQREKGFALLFIAHDLAMVRFLSDRVGVMLHGRLVETADTRTLFGAPAHPYTKSLLSAMHIPDPAAERSKALFEYDTAQPLSADMVEVGEGHFVLT